jgi:Zn-dependent oligopeptidase
VCAANGGMTAGNGDRLREHVLSRGMTREPAAMFAAFCGRPPDPRALLARRGLAVTGRS